jgi:hypothetical protein
MFISLPRQEKSCDKACQLAQNEGPFQLVQVVPSSALRSQEFGERNSASIASFASIHRQKFYRLEVVSGSISVGKSLNKCFFWDDIP